MTASQSSAPLREPTPVGPFGQGGRSFDDLDHLSKHGPLLRLLVKAGDIVDDVVAVHGSAEAAHVVRMKGADDEPIAIELRDDPLVGISGSYGNARLVDVAPGRDRRGEA